MALIKKIIAVKLNILFVVLFKYVVIDMTSYDELVKMVGVSIEASYIFDQNMEIVFVNSKFVDVMGYEISEFKKLNLENVMNDDSNIHDECIELMVREFKIIKYWHGEIWKKRKNGEVFPTWLSIYPILSENNIENLYIVQFHEISQHLTYLPRLDYQFRKAHSAGNIEIYYQPIFDIKTGQPVCLEALIRNNCNSLGKVNIETQISNIEISGYIVNLDKWVIEQVLKVADKLKNEYEVDVNFSINISSKLLVNSMISFSSWLDGMFEKYNINPNNIELEITERLLITNIELALEEFEKLKIMGVLLSIDDFGMGYSSFNYLKKYKFDKLKVDKVFLEECKGEENFELVHGIINMAHALGLEVIIEGVEKQSQLNKIKEFSCDYVQGYYLDKAMLIEDFLNKYFKKNIKN